jgi:hypothetical protein
MWALLEIDVLISRYPVLCSDLFVSSEFTVLDYFVLFNSYMQGSCLTIVVLMLWFGLCYHVTHRIFTKKNIYVQ